MDVISFQLCGDRDNPSVSFGEKAYCLPANPMSDRGQAVCYCVEGQNCCVDSKASFTLQAGRPDDHHIPSVCYALEGNGSRPSHKGDGYSCDGKMYTLNTIEKHAVCYGISSFSSHAMLSANPHSGIYEAKTSRCLDLNGGNPTCNQGGIIVVQTMQGKVEEEDV